MSFLFISKDIVVISENNLQFARDYLEMEKLVIFNFFVFVILWLNVSSYFDYEFQ